MTRKEALKAIEYAKERAEVIREQGQSEYWAQEINWTIEALDMVIEALKAPQEWDEFIFDTNEFFSIVDDGKITVMRRGKGKVTVERPVMRMETTICSYGERSE